MEEEDLNIDDIIEEEPTCSGTTVQKAWKLNAEEPAYSLKRLISLLLSFLSSIIIKI